MIRTRSPLSPGQALVLARLACIRRAASVRPEPGSNSPSRSSVPPGINRGFLKSESCRQRSLTSSGNFVPPRSISIAGRFRGRHGIDMWVLSSDRGRIPAPALALGFHCSVFKKRTFDRRQSGVEPDTHPRCWSEVLRAQKRARPPSSYENVGVNRLRSSGPVKRARSGVRGEGRD